MSCSSQRSRASKPSGLVRLFRHGIFGIFLGEGRTGWWMVDAGPFQMQRGNVRSWLVQIQAGDDRDGAVVKTPCWLMLKYGGILSNIFWILLGSHTVSTQPMMLNPINPSSMDDDFWNTAQLVLFAAPKLRVLDRSESWNILWCSHHLKVSQVWSSWNQYKRLASHCKSMSYVFHGPWANIRRPGDSERCFGRFTHLIAASNTIFSAWPFIWSILCGEFAIAMENDPFLADLPMMSLVPWAQPRFPAGAMAAMAPRQWSSVDCGNGRSLWRWPAWARTNCSTSKTGVDWWSTRGLTRIEDGWRWFKRRYFGWGTGILLDLYWFTAYWL